MCFLNLHGNIAYSIEYKVLYLVWNENKYFHVCYLFKDLLGGCTKVELPNTLNYINIQLNRINTFIECKQTILCRCCPKIWINTNYQLCFNIINTLINIINMFKMKILIELMGTYILNE